MEARGQTRRHAPLPIALLTPSLLPNPRNLFCIYGAGVGLTCLVSICTRPPKIARAT